MTDSTRIEIAREAFYESLVKQALDEIADEELLPNDAYDAHDLEPSARHAKRMNDLFARHRRKAAFLSAANVTKRIAAVVAIVLGAAFSLALISPQVRAAVRDFIVEVYEKFTRFSYSSDEVSLEAGKWYPEWLPDGYELTDESTNGNISRLTYQDSAGTEIRIRYSHGDDATIDSDNDYRTSDMVIHDGIEYFYGSLTGQQGRNQIVWVKDGYRFVLESSESTEILLEVAQSTGNN